MAKIKLPKREPMKSVSPPLPEPEFFDTTPDNGPWTPAQLYARSAKNRRVMFLELMVWAIYQAESCATRSEFSDFEKELREVREEQWGIHPWSSATEPDQFLNHVRQMAEAFTGAARYPGRR